MSEVDFVKGAGVHPQGQDGPDHNSYRYRAKNMRAPLLAILLILVLEATACAAVVRLSAASSTTDAVKALIVRYKEKAPDINIQTNFAASGTLAKQISFGAPADLVIFANPDWVDYLINEQRLAAGSVRTLAGNSLVLVGNKRLSVPTLEAVSKLNRIAIGSPKSVPAGQYAEQALSGAGLLNALRGKLVMAKDARQALIYADQGEVDAAFVYRTDALLAENAVILYQVPQTFYEKIIYPVGLTPAGAQNRAAVAFLEFLNSETAREILNQYGFTGP